MTVILVQPIAVHAIGGVSLKGSRGKPWAHAPGGCECEVHETFTCDRCGRRFGYCLGVMDNMPGACDFCWKPEGTEASP